MGTGVAHSRTKKFYRLREEAYKKQQKKCFYCGVKMVKRGKRKDGLSGDLVIPHYKGGRVTEDNIVAACRGCNSAKEHWTQGPVVRQGDGMGWDDLWKVVIVSESNLSIPPTQKQLPVTTVNILKELRDDVEVYPKNGDLSGWNKQGVLLWNAGPSCEVFFSSLSKRGVVFSLLGRKAESYRTFIDESESEVIVLSLPSSRSEYMGKGNLRSAQAFLGSRLFSTINTKLVELGHSPVDWRL